MSMQIEPRNSTGPTVQKVERWIDAKRRLASDRERLKDSFDRLSIATNDLAAWLVPEDVKLDEVFHIWFGSGILAAKCTSISPRSFSVEWRKEPDRKQAMEQGV